jgi:CBS domain-containing protein
MDPTPQDDPMTIRECMTAEPTAISPDVSLVDAAHLMLDFGVGFLPVVDQARLVGVITDRDLVVRGLAENRSPLDTTVGELMSIEVVCCFVDQTVEDASALMQKHQLRRLPVIDREHRLVGLLSLGQLGLPNLPHKPYVKVTFKKTKTDSYGHKHPIKLKSIYITSTADRDAAVSTAVKQYEEEQDTVWENVADEITVEEADKSHKQN